MKLSATTPRRLRDQFPETASDEALDLMSKMLEFSPKTRISVEDALRHPFLQSLHVSEPPRVSVVALSRLILLFGQRCTEHVYFLGRSFLGGDDRRGYPQGGNGITGW